MSGFKGMIEVWPACLVAGVFFAIPQFIVSNYFGPSLVDIVAAIVSISATYALLKAWQPKHIWRFPEEREEAHPVIKKHSAGEAFLAWMPWIVLTVFVFIWGQPVVKTWLNGIFAPSFEMSGLHNLVQKVPPVAKKP
jgi:lactate permease